MGRTPLIAKLKDALSIAAESAQRGIPADEILDERRSTRRRFVEQAGAAGLAAASVGTFGRFAPMARAAAPQKIVIVGAGLAGLTCAHRLKQAGIVADIYEASDRLGGRCWTRRGDFAEQQIAEHGGELIDQGHLQIRHLAQELGLPLDNLLRAQPNGTEDFFYFEGHEYPYSQVVEDLNGIYQKLHKDVSAASYPTLFDNYTQRGWELDHMSIVDWLDETVPGGASAPLGQLLDVAYNIEYGAECDTQSALNLIYLLGYIGQGQFRVFGKSNEKYHVRGGNDLIVTGLADAIGESRILRGHELVAIVRTTDGTYTLTFKNGGGIKVVKADRVVLALPFSILRSSVDYSQAGFEPLKVTAIQEQGMGINSKLHLQFSRRQWYELQNNGNTYSDTGYQATWEVTRSQAGKAGILVDYTGGDTAATFGSGTPATKAKTFLKQLEPVLPGITGCWNGKATVDSWLGNPWTKGSYSLWTIGQYTKFAGIEGKQQGNCHFAGEHTSIDFIGYLNGAVETGERAAAEILK